MRFVRYTRAEYSAAAHMPSPRWGLLVDSLIIPLLEEPWSLRPGGAWTPVLDPSSSPVPLSEVRLHAPVTPSKILCVGRNYAEHAAELGNDVPPEPLIFLKPPSSIQSPGDAVVYPSISQRVDHEAELALVIGTRCRFTSEEDASACIFGYTVANDVTARDLQKSDGQWTRAKGFDTFCPVGPWLDTSFDPTGRTVRCTVNGVVRQESSIDRMIFPVSRIIAHIAQVMTLEPGDLILTGTPAGIAPIQPGDVMSVEIDGLGSIHNPVVGEKEYRAQIARQG